MFANVLKVSMVNVAIVRICILSIFTNCFMFVLSVLLVPGLITTSNLLFIFFLFGLRENHFKNKCPNFNFRDVFWPITFFFKLSMNNHLRSEIFSFFILFVQCVFALLVLKSLFCCVQCKVVVIHHLVWIMQHVMKVWKVTFVNVHQATVVVFVKVSLFSKSLFFLKLYIYSEFEKKVH